MSTQLQSILSQLETALKLNQSSIKYYDLIDFETVKKLKERGYIIKSDSYDDFITIYL